MAAGTRPEGLFALRNSGDRPLTWCHEPAGPAPAPASSAATAAQGSGPGWPQPAATRAGPSGCSGCCSACSSASCSSPPTPAATAASPSPTPTFLDQAETGKVESITVQQQRRPRSPASSRTARSSPPPASIPFPDADLALLREEDVEVKPKTQTPSFLETWLPLLLPGGADHRLLRLDAAPGPGPDGQHHVHRPVAGRRPTPPSGRAPPSPTSPATRA